MALPLKASRRYMRPDQLRVRVNKKADINLPASPPMVSGHSLHMTLRIRAAAARGSISLFSSIYRSEVLFPALTSKCRSLPESRD